MVHSVPFDVLFAFLIMLNCILVAYSINRTATTLEEDPEPTLELIMQCLNMMFVVEWILRVVANGRSFFKFGSNWVWNWFDTVTTLLIVLADWALVLGAGAKGKFQLSNLRAVKAL